MRRTCGVVLAVGLIGATGCTGKGWQVEFGMAPCASIEADNGLGHESARWGGKAVGATYFPVDTAMGQRAQAYIGASAAMGMYFHSLGDIITTFELGLDFGPLLTRNAPGGGGKSRRCSSS